jgi:GNAT superfamily N-acetyltransferase
MARLADGWVSERRSASMDDGEAFLGALSWPEKLAGIGGLSVEPAAHPSRHAACAAFTFAPTIRRRGVARTALASALIQEAFDQVDLLTCNAAASPAAAPFWEAQGFSPDTSGSLDPRAAAESGMTAPTDFARDGAAHYSRCPA